MSKPISDKTLFIILMVAAYAVSYAPVVHVPFEWLEAYFHEISHGLAALLSGGSVESIKLRTDGSGVCFTRGGSRFFILFAGYTGAVLWGLLIYLSAKSLGKRANIIAILLLAMIGVSTALWARDTVTILILVLMAVLLFIQAKFSLGYWVTALTQFIGIYVMQGALRSPTYLIDGRKSGDGADLAGLTSIPEIVWVIIWLLIAVGGFWYAWRHHNG